LQIFLTNMRRKELEMLVFKRSDTWCTMEPDDSPGNVPLPTEDDHNAHIDLHLTDNVTLTPWWNGGTDPNSDPDPFAVPDLEAHPGSDGVAGGVGLKIEF
jgi:hypothetical protein